ncbi:MAG: hypothetical protein LBH98_00005, partial [Chitinispirillales bacterium]|nr:hypothetical protein [Chitinispirillales bacterium]
MLTVPPVISRPVPVPVAKEGMLIVPCAGAVFADVTTAVFDTVILPPPLLKTAQPVDASTLPPETVTVPV